MKIVVSAITGFLLVFPFAHADDAPYYTNVSEKNMGCIIGRAFKKQLQTEGKSWSQKKQELVARLKSFAPFEAAFNSGDSMQSLLTQDKAYLVQDAFMDPSLLTRLPKENWFGAYYHMLIVAFSRRGGGIVEEDYNFVDDPRVLQKAEKYLSVVENAKTLRMEIPYTKEEIEKKYGPLEKVKANGTKEIHVITVYTASWMGGAPAKTLEPAYAHMKKMNTLASPLFVWLVKQPKESVGHAELFQKATEIYGDPFTALGSIAWIVGYEGSMGSRKRGAVASYRIKPILQRVSDHNGSIYHFWGYLVRGILGEPDGITWLRTRSRIYEGLIQKDGQDVTADMFGLRVAESVLKNLESESDSCTELTAGHPNERDPAVDSDTSKKLVPAQSKFATPAKSSTEAQPAM